MLTPASHVVAVHSSQGDRGTSVSHMPTLEFIRNPFDQQKENGDSSRNSKMSRNFPGPKLENQM